MPEEQKEAKRSIWKRLFSGWRRESDREAGQIDTLPIATVVESFVDEPMADPEGKVVSGSQDYAKVAWKLPENRLGKYPILQTMAKDPTINSAIKMHVAHALSAKPDTNEAISIESTSDKEDPIVIDLRNTFKQTINKCCQGWAYNAAIWGMWPVRLYGRPGLGVEMIRSDYYTHPRHIKIFERCGQVAGYTSAHQMPERGRLRLMEPWKFVCFKIPLYSVHLGLEPIRLSGREFDISNDDFRNEDLIETQDYGESLIETAYGPWMDLLEAIVSLNASRKNASRVERLVGVNTGKLNPQRAALYLRTVAEQLQKVGEADANRSLLRGYVQTVVNHLIPIWGDSKGRLEISTVEGNPNIEAIEDIDFAIKRLGSALGIDPALLGFGEMLSGGLGDGGFFRVSILAAIKATLLRRAIASGLEELFDIHVAFKYGKVFLPGEKPWRIMFNSLSSAMEREEMEGTTERANLATLVATLVQMMDPEGTGIDKPAYRNFMWTDLLKVDEEKFKAIYPKKLENEQPSGGDDGFGAPPQRLRPPSPSIMESGHMPEANLKDRIREMVFEAMAEIQGGD